jgi:site-specific recombinase XerD
MRPTSPHPDDAAIIDAFVHHTVHVDGRSQGSVRGHRCTLRRFLHWCRQHDLDGIRLSEIQVTAFLDAEVTRGLKPMTVASVQGTLRCFYAYLRPDGPNPARATPLPVAGPSTPVPYRPDEAERILEQLRHARNLGQRFDLAVVATFAGTGVQRRELLRLRTGDLDLDAGVLMVRDGPTGDRTVPLPPVTAEVLHGYLVQIRPLCPRSDRLFANPRASFDSPLYGELEETVASSIVRRAGRRSGVDGPHTCMRWRVTATVELLRAGVDLAEVQRRLGHGESATTAVYLRAVGTDDVVDRGVVR